MSITINGYVAESFDFDAIHIVDRVRFNNAKNHARALFYAGVTTEYRANIGDNVWVFSIK